MKTPSLTTLLFTAAVFSCSVSEAATIQFDLQGAAGFGLRPGNQVPAVSGGSGGEISAGISFDSGSNQLTLNVGWGTANGFTNLTGTTTGGHLHGPTPDGGVLSFSENAGVQYPLDGLPGWNTSASAGGFIGTIAIAPRDVAPLLNGQFYFNVHTATNGGGEIRGNLVQAAPEPTSLGLVAVGALGLLARRKRRTA